jgi:hypothetical protein
VLHKRGIKADAVVGSPASGAVLKAAKLERADAAIVCGLGGDPGANDTQVRRGLGFPAAGRLGSEGSRPHPGDCAPGLAAWRCG